MQQQKQPGSKKDKKLYQNYHRRCSSRVGKFFLHFKHCLNFDKAQASLGYGNMDDVYVGKPNPYINWVDKKGVRFW